MNPGPNPKTSAAGVSLAVIHQDGRAETIQVRLVPRERYADLARALSDYSEDGEFAEVGLYVPGRDADWWRSLSESSVAEVLRVGSQLNRSEFLPWLRRAARHLSLVTDDPSVKQAAHCLSGDGSQPHARFSGTHLN